MAKRTRKIKKPDYGKRIIKANLRKLYPTIYCTAERIYIAVSTRPLPSFMKTVKGPNGKPTRIIEYKKKISYDYFEDWCCKWRDPKYKINMKEFKVGDLVRCPNCKCEVDFRAYPSYTIPDFTEVIKDDKKGNTEEFSSTQK